PYLLAGIGSQKRRDFLGTKRGAWTYIQESKHRAITHVFPTSSRVSIRCTATGSECLTSAITWCLLRPPSKAVRRHSINHATRARGSHRTRFVRFLCLGPSLSF
ncbi:unnamed protein product, partial [Ectocarpus sp. 12 AP-2014]